MTEPHPGTAAAASPWAVFATVAIGTFMATLDSSITNVAMPTLARAFAAPGAVSAPVTLIEWVPLAYLLTITALLLPFGRMGDRFGRRRVYLGGFCLFTLGSALCALSRSVEALVAFRVVQGVGASMAGANGAALVTQAFPRESRGKALGLIGAVVGLALTVGPPLGGMLLGLPSGWPTIFLVNLPIGALGVGMALGKLPRDAPASHAVGAPSASPAPGAPPARPAFDFAGAGLILAALLAFTLGLSRGPTWGWGSPGTVGLLGATGAGLVLFALVERRSADPLVDFTFFRSPVFASAVLSLFLAYAAFFASIFLVPFYLERVGGLTPAGVGRVLVVVPLMLLGVSPLSGALSDRMGSRTLASLGLVLTAAGLALLAWMIGRDDGRPASVWAILGGLLVVGCGQGLFQPPNSSAAMGALPSSRLGLAGGLLAIMRNLGMLTGIAIAASVYEGREAHYLRTLGRLAATGHGMRDAFLAAAGIAVVGSAVAAGRGRADAVPDAASSVARPTQDGLGSA